MLSYRNFTGDPLELFFLFLSSSKPQLNGHCLFKTLTVIIPSLAFITYLALG